MRGPDAPLERASAACHAGTPEPPHGRNTVPQEPGNLPTAGTIICPRALPLTGSAQIDSLLRDHQRSHVVAAPKRACHGAAPRAHVGTGASRSPGRSASRCTTGAGACARACTSATGSCTSSTCSRTSTATCLGERKGASRHDERGRQQWCRSHENLLWFLLTLSRQVRKPA